MLFEYRSVVLHGGFWDPVSKISDRFLGGLVSGEMAARVTLFFLPCRVNHHKFVFVSKVSDSSGPVAVSWAGKQNPWITDSSLLNIRWQCLSCTYCLSKAVRSVYLSHSQMLFQFCTKDLLGKCRLLSKVNTTLHSKESGGDSWMSPSPYQDSPHPTAHSRLWISSYI